MIEKSIIKLTKLKPSISLADGLVSLSIVEELGDLCLLNGYALKGKSKLNLRKLCYEFLRRAYKCAYKHIRHYEVMLYLKDPIIVIKYVNTVAIPLGLMEYDILFKLISTMISDIINLRTDKIPGLCEVKQDIMKCRTTKLNADNDGYDYEAIYPTIRNINKKFQRSVHHEFIKNIRSSGYYFDCHPLFVSISKSRFPFVSS